MTNPVLGIVVTIGVIIGSALFYYLNSESRQAYQTGYNAPPNNYSYTPASRPSPRGRRRRDDGDCIICLESLTNGKAVESLRCSHEFHKTCIATWFQTSHKRECPVCRLNSC